MNAWSRAQFVTRSASVALAATVPADAQSSPQTVRVGCAANDDFAEAYYADAMGFFKNVGLNAEIQTLSSGAAASDAVVGGSLDFAITTPLLLANGHLRGVPFAIVAAGPISSVKAPAAALCVAKDGPIARAQDLVGKTVGLNVLDTVLQLSLDAYLTAHKVSVSDVKAVEVVFPAEAPAIQRGTIAAAILPEPFLAISLKRGDVRVLGYPYQYVGSRFLLGAWFTSREFARQHPDVVRRFSSAIYQAGRWANTHSDGSAAILAKHTKIPPNVIHSMVRAEFADRMDISDMQALLDVAVRYHFLSKPVRAADLLVSS